MYYMPNCSRVLSQADPKSVTPVGFRGELYDPQKTLLYAMKEMECNKKIMINDAINVGYLPHIHTNVCRISEKFSFGKTILALALICSSKESDKTLSTTDISPTIGFNNILGSSTSLRRIANLSYSSMFHCVLPEIKVNYASSLKITIVIAAANIITQWESETTRFTDLKYITIDNVFSLQRFKKAYIQNQLNGLDIIFVKSGRVSTSFVVDGEKTAPNCKEIFNGKNRSLFGAVSKILEGVPVTRLIIDDYDTLKMSGDDCLIPALFTWIISATQRQTVKRVPDEPLNDTVEAYFKSTMTINFPVLNLSHNHIVNTTFSIRCQPEYVDSFLNSTRVLYRHILVKGGQIARILRNLDVSEEVIEMINSDAFATAAQTLGIEAYSANDVIRRLVGKHMDKIIRANLVLSRIEEITKSDSKLPQSTDIKKTLIVIKNGTNEEFADILLTENMTDLVPIMNKWATEQLNTYGKSLDRMRNNLHEGECQCCMLPFDKDNKDEVAYIMSGCCQIIVCENCIVDRRYTPANYIKRCPNCSCSIEAKNGLIRVSNSIDLNVKIEHFNEPECCAPEADIKQLEFSHLINTKIKALMQLISSTLRDNKIHIDCVHDKYTSPFISGLLSGNVDIPWPDTIDKKILIFTMYPESTRLIGITLEQFNIPFCILRGTRAKKDEAINILKTKVNVILVTSPQDCGGLHLPILSHIVFYHKVIDPNVEAQVAARGQRLGRKGNLEIVAIHNEVEFEHYSN